MSNSIFLSTGISFLCHETFIQSVYIVRHLDDSSFSFIHDLTICRVYLYDFIQTKNKQIFIGNNQTPYTKVNTNTHDIPWINVFCVSGISNFDDNLGGGLGSNIVTQF